MIAIACDHTALHLKGEIISLLKAKGLEYEDMGTYSEERAEYPEYAEKLALSVVSGAHEKGILICGTGIGMSIAAGKVNGTRVCVCSDCYSAKLSRQHNDSNILCLGARVVGSELAKMIVDIWLDAKFEGGRHAERIAKFAEIEKRQK